MTLDVRLGEVLVLERLWSEVVDVAFDKVESRDEKSWQLLRWKVARSGLPGCRQLSFLRRVLMLLVR